jgi:hypothetical protein
MSVTIVAGVILSGAWTQLDEIGWAGWLALAVVFALDRARRPFDDWPVPRRPEPVRDRVPVAAAAAICLLLLAHAGLTVREEFGFSGDEGYHLSATRTFALYYLRAGPYLAGALLLFGVFRARAWRYAATVTMAALWAASHALPASPLFGRYPAGFYLLSTPLNVAFEVVSFPYPFSANHIINALSVPAWLFVLRPLVIGRWPDWPVLPVAALLYFQGPALTYVVSSVLEPWAIVFLLLAFEALVVFDRGDRWMAVILAAVATGFKETAVLFIPTVWVLAMLEWREWTGLRPPIRRGAVAVGVAAVTPFLIYFAVRQELRIGRSVDLVASAGVWTEARAFEWLANAHTLVGTSGAVAIGAVTLWVVGLMVIRPARREYATWLATAAALVLFFFAESASIPFTGHARFLLFPLLALSAVVIGESHRMPDRRAMLVGATAAIALLQAVPLVRTFALDFRPDYQRNSLEGHGSLIRLPIRALAEQIPALPGGDQVRRIRVMTFGVDQTSVRVAYPDLAARYELLRDEQGGPAVDCACRDADEAVLAGFTWPAHFDDTPEARALFGQISVACVDQVARTCAAQAVERHGSGAAVGVVGIGVPLGRR